MKLLDFSFSKRHIRLVEFNKNELIYHVVYLKWSNSYGDVDRCHFSLPSAFPQKVAHRLNMKPHN